MPAPAVQGWKHGEPVRRSLKLCNACPASDVAMFALLAMLANLADEHSLLKKLPKCMKSERARVWTGQGYICIVVISNPISPGPGGFQGRERV